jgi:CIC family chloride channel protein
MLATGLLAGLCGPLFIWLMSYSHRCFTHEAVAAVAAGAGRADCRPAVAHHACGVGQWLQRGAKHYLLSPPLFSAIAVVFVCKLLAVLASSGSGAPGGVFTPTLFVGLAMGMLFASFSGLWLHHDQGWRL